MPLEIQIKLNENLMYKQYLRTHSRWYKILIRNPNLFKQFIEEMKAEYKLRPIDKVNKTVDALNVISNLFNSML